MDYVEWIIPELDITVSGAFEKTNNVIIVYLEIINERWVNLIKYAVGEENCQVVKDEAQGLWFIYIKPNKHFIYKQPLSLN